MKNFAIGAWVKPTKDVWSMHRFHKFKQLRGQIVDKKKVIVDDKPNILYAISWVDMPSDAPEGWNGPEYISNFIELTVAPIRDMKHDADYYAIITGERNDEIAK